MTTATGIMFNDWLALTLTDRYGHDATDYARAYRGIDAGLWVDEGGDVLGDDDDMATLVNRYSLIAKRKR